MPGDAPQAGAATAPAGDPPAPCGGVRGVPGAAAGLGGGWDPDAPPEARSPPSPSFAPSIEEEQEGGGAEPGAGAGVPAEAEAEAEAGAEAEAEAGANALLYARSDVLSDEDDAAQLGVEHLEGRGHREGARWVALVVGDECHDGLVPHRGTGARIRQGSG